MHSALASADQLIPLVKTPEGEIQTEPFLNVSKQLLPLIGEPHENLLKMSRYCATNFCLIGWLSAADQLGSAFYLVKHDVGGNIEVSKMCISFHSACELAKLTTNSSNGAEEHPVWGDGNVNSCIDRTDICSMP